MSWVAEHVMPRDLAEVSAMLAAQSEGPPWMPRGGGTLLGRGAMPREPVSLLDLSSCRAVLEHAHDDLSITVEAGITLAEVERVLGEHGQWLPVSLAPDVRSTVGGWIGADRRSPIAGGLGSVRDYLIGIGTMDARGRTLRAGGRVVKNVAGYDLMKLFTGSLGELGVIVEATFKVLPRPARWAGLLVERPEMDALHTALREGPKLFPVAIWHFNAGSGDLLALVFAGSATRVNAQVARARTLMNEDGRILDHEETLQLAGELEDNTLPGSESVAWGGCLPEYLSRARLGSFLGDRWTADLLRGHIWASLKDADLAGARGALRDGEGHLHVDAPSDRPIADPWGRTSPDPALEAGLKRALDPEGRFVTGRWPGPP